MERLHYLETGSTDPAYNLAFEEYVLTHRMDGDYLILWQNDNTVVVGQNQNTAAEINRAYQKAQAELPLLYEQWEQAEAALGSEDE